MDQQVYAMKIADIFNSDVRKKIILSVNKKIKSVFPSPDSLYSKDIVKKHDLTHIIIPNFNLNNSIPPANTINNISLGFTSGGCQTNPITTAVNMNVSSNNNYNFPNSKKKYFEEDNSNINNNGNSNSKIGFSGKNKKANGKIQYREKIISSSISNKNNADNKNDNFDNCIENEKKNFTEMAGHNTLSNQIIPDADINSNETTSTSSKDDNFNNNNKQGENLSNKNDEKNFGELIEIIKFDSGKLSAFDKLTNIENVPCKEVNKIIFNSSNSQDCSSKFSNSDMYTYKKLFSFRDSSRFNFVKKNNNTQSNNNNNKNNNHSKNIENVEIPDFVLSLIRKKVSRQKLSKKFEFIEDILYRDDLLQKEYINENHWAEFILENKNMCTDKELIFDFEIINKSLKDKFKTYYLK